MNVGGTAVYLSNLQKGLQENGIISPVVIGKTQNSEIEDSSVNKMDIVRIESLSNSFSMVGDFKALISLKNFLKLNKFDILHSHTFKAGVLA